LKRAVVHDGQSYIFSSLKKSVTFADALSGAFALSGGAPDSGLRVVGGAVRKPPYDTRNIGASSGYAELALRRALVDGLGATLHDFRASCLDLRCILCARAGSLAGRLCEDWFGGARSP